MLPKRIFRVLALLTELLILSITIAPRFSGFGPTDVASQQPAFELPVQLVGFPVIILAVRMSNFIRKLAYSLNPSTYRRSTRHVRDALYTEPAIDFVKVENELVKHLGPEVCIYEEICLDNVYNAGSKTPSDWQKMLGKSFSSIPAGKQRFYVLSIFLGDIIRSQKLCQHFSKIGRNCH